MRTNIVVPLLLLGVAERSSTAMAQSMGTFTATGKLAKPQQSHTATLLTNGKVLVAGGYDITSGWTIWASAELYDPSTGTFHCHSQNDCTTLEAQSDFCSLPE